MGEQSGVLILEKVQRTFRQGQQKLEVLRSVDLQVQPGEMVAMIGPSGAGKSTLLHVAGLLEPPDQGRVIVGDIDCRELNDDERTRIRRDFLGFVYQHHHLLPEFSAVENIIVPQRVAGIPKKTALERAIELLTLMGLDNRASHRPAKLSGGERQRVAIARALANVPRVLLADEPTGNLDPETAKDVFDLLIKIVRGAEIACIVATHNLELAQAMDRIVRLEDGRLVPHVP